MSSTAAANTPTAPARHAPVALPPNVCIFSPTNPSAAKALLEGRIFTRLTAGAQSDPTQLSAVLKEKAGVTEGFSLVHRNVVLIFDGGDEGADVEDTHHEHFRLVCLALKDADIGLDVAGCIFDSPDVSQAGFQLDSLSSGSVLVIDLMHGQGDDDSEHGDDLGVWMEGDSGVTLS